MNYNLRVIFEAFKTEGSFKNAVPFGSGHIHDTFLAETSEHNKDNYVLQRLNNKVFKNIPELQENIERVTKHLCFKLSQIPGADLKRECLTLVYAKNGKSWIQDDQGGFWRMFIYIPDHRSYDLVDTPEKAYEGGKAIGRFQALLADLPGKPLYETIPDFHNIEKRLETFNSSVKSDKAGRVGTTQAEIRFVLKRAVVMQTILKLGRDNKIPLRITHNDTKFNNILLDEKNRGLCLIDLDTVMPGYVHYDFGDAIRTAANKGAEDEPDLLKVAMDIDLFRAYSEGYLSETRKTLNDIEKEYLPFAPGLMAFTMAVRFLTDYIDGDIYYKIHHEHHNLQRAKAQMKLIESMEEQYSEMKKIIRKLS